MDFVGIGRALKRDLVELLQALFVRGR